jgi:hypothetical protein
MIIGFDFSATASASVPVAARTSKKTPALTSTIPTTSPSQSRLLTTPPRRLKMASRLEKLPPELLLYAAEFITRPSDLKALCLTCKILRDCALPPLYHTVVLGDRGGYWKPSIPGKGLLLVGNHGLVHVRRLDIPGAIRYKHGKFDDAGLQYLRLLLLIMPRNVLRSL